MINKKQTNIQYRTKVNIQEDFIRNKYLTSATHLREHTLL